MNFKELLYKAQSGDHQATEKILNHYKPLLLKESVINGVFDEDLYQELCITFLRCVHAFRLGKSIE